MRLPHQVRGTATVPQSLNKYPGQKRAGVADHQGHDQAQAHERLGNHRQALADREKALALGPNDPRLLNRLAWRYVTGPVMSRDPARALPLARRAVELGPNEATYQNTLGVVLYRLDRYPEAIPVLEKSLALGKGRWDAFDHFFLAMCHAKLRDAGKARDCFARAAKWVDGQKGLSAQHVQELKAFRAEAEAVLSGLKQAPEE